LKIVVVLCRLALPQKLDKLFQVPMATLVIKTRAAKTILLGPLEKYKLYKNDNLPFDFSLYGKIVCFDPGINFLFIRRS